ncbi:putative prolyl oligopeptidase [Trypanosoma cruzi]|uniref:Putative prolyl oligopeptidase n=1 Tax=Trypanosoma cruzi TaxID=5693 RepID=A0A2V2UTT2_TRYCR|nr:putative prolyl oligopeptidase [Trypanosoma cruzi]
MKLLVKELQLGYAELGDMELSSDEQHLALALDCSNGREVFTIFLLEITDVNHARWLDRQLKVHRAWAEAMVRSEQSIYTSPVPVLSAHRSPTTPTGRSSGTNTMKKTCKKHAVTQSLSSLSLALLPKTFTPTKSSTKMAEPAHKIARRIDAFDALDEVLWISPTSLLYLGTDEKMRAHLIYHDLNSPVHAEQTDIICYEELDEAFCVSSLFFSVDGRFAMFTVCSNSYSEVHVIPCDAGVEKCVSGVPVFPTTANDKGEGLQNNTCAVHCFADRNFCMDYDIDHHRSLFGEGVDAWVVTATKSSKGLGKFRVAYVLDEDEKACCKDAVGGGNRTLSDPSCWQPLFAYDTCIEVEDIECMRDYLLLSVGRAASSTVLLLPVRVLWDRWRDCHGRNMPSLFLQDDTVDLRQVASRPFHSSDEVRFSFAQLLQEQRLKKDNNSNEEKEKKDMSLMS